MQIFAGFYYKCWENQSLNDYIDYVNTRVRFFQEIIKNRTYLKRCVESELIINKDNINYHKRQSLFNA